MTKCRDYLRSGPEVMVQYSSSVIHMADPDFQSNRMLNRACRALSETDSAWLRFAPFLCLILSVETLIYALVLALRILHWHFAGFILHVFFVQLLIPLTIGGSLMFLLYCYWKRRNTLIPITSIGISADGLTIYHGSVAFGVNNHLPWQSITNIGIVHDFPIEQAGKMEALIRVNHLDGNELRLRLNAIRSIEERKLLVEAFKAYARRAVDAEDLARMVRASDVQDIPFTQLWSEALRSSLPRGSLSTLPPSTLLQQGRFFVRGQIGGGGQGAIYLAEMLDEADQKINVALKE